MSACPGFSLGLFSYFVIVLIVLSNGVNVLSTFHVQECSDPIRDKNGKNLIPPMVHRCVFEISVRKSHIIRTSLMTLKGRRAFT